MKIENFSVAYKSIAPSNQGCGAKASTQLDWALAYAKRGWRVFPLHSIQDGRCTCGRDCDKTAGKHPRVKGGFKAATTDARQIETWWRKWLDANIGIATGDGLIVLDIDGANGLAFLKTLVSQHGALPRTAIVKTARGLHLYFATPVTCASIPCSTGNGLDARGDGGYCVAPPSRHASGHLYQWREGASALAEAPAWLLEWARSRNHTASADPMIVALGEPPADLKNRPSGVPSLAKRALKALTPQGAYDEPQLRSALTVIPAVDRDIWLRVGMAIHEAGWGARGFGIWRGWSQAAPEKYNDADQARTWESFDRPPRDGRRITLATVFHMAMERGWNAGDSSNHQIQSQGDGAANDTAPSGGESKNPAPTDGDREIARLAKLSRVEYDRERQAAADRMKIRVTTLDKEVEDERGETENGDKQGHALSLPEPEPWPEPVNGTELFDALVMNIRRHVVMFDHAADTAALWVVHTFLLDCFGISPRLAITSPEKGCGKTTLLDVLTHLVFRPLPTSNASVAAIFRVVELKRPTLLIDEADTFLPEKEELRGILDSGHRLGGYALRTVGENFNPRQFATYSACGIALIGRLPATLADRSVTIELRRRRPDETIEQFRFDRTSHLDQLARKAARWAADVSL